MTLYVVTRWTPDTTTDPMTLELETDLECHLYLATSEAPPAKRPRYIRTRGIDRLCGYTWHWRTPISIDQNEPGATTTHTWPVPLPTTLRSIWTLPTESPLITEHEATSIPMELRPTVPPFMWVSETTTTGLAAGSTHTPLWDTDVFTQAFPHPPLPFTPWSPPLTQATQWFADTHLAILATTTLEWQLTDLTTSSLIDTVSQLFLTNPATAFQSGNRLAPLIHTHQYSIALQNQGPGAATIVSPFGEMLIQIYQP